MGGQISSSVEAQSSPQHDRPDTTVAQTHLGSEDGPGVWNPTVSALVIAGERDALFDRCGQAAFFRAFLIVGGQNRRRASCKSVFAAPQPNATVLDLVIS
jgi:hypothetical protein